MYDERLGLDALDLFDKGFEGVLVAYGEVREDFSVEFHLLGLQDADEGAVADVEGTERVPEADDPE